jgi:hypothetical protein
MLNSSFLYLFPAFLISLLKNLKELKEKNQLSLNIKTIRGHPIPATWTELPLWGYP